MYLLVFAQLQISLPPMMIVTLLTDLEDLIVSFSASVNYRFGPRLRIPSPQE